MVPLDAPMEISNREGVKSVKKYIPFLSFWLINSLFLYLAAFALPLHFVLGNFWLSPVAAIFFAGFWITAVIQAAEPILKRLNITLKGSPQMFLFYWVSNTVAIWLVARVSHLTGFGISRFYWAIFLGLVLNFAQWGLWRLLKEAKLLGK